MPGGSSIQALLTAPGVRERKLVSFKPDDAAKNNDVDAVSAIIATSSPAPESAFHVLDLAKVVNLFDGWRRSLPGVRPYYAVKCNPEPALLGALAELGAGFDCATRAEMEAVLALGVHPGRIVYANPCKPEAHLRYAAEAGVNLATYDSEDEVAKVARCHPECELLLRVKAPADEGGAPAARFDLGTKYGAHAGEVAPLLLAARRAGLGVAGVSFHVGSGAYRVGVYRAAVEAARAAFDAAAALGMPPMRVLDVGGGFTAGATFGNAAAVINGALAQHFGDGDLVDVIGEPGRYFAETAFTLAARVIGKRRRGEVREYWIDDGIYGSLNVVNTDHYVLRPRPLLLASSSSSATSTGHDNKKTYTSTVFGPTCDSLDTVVTGYQLPEMSVGDWLVFHNMGAYTTALASNFNGFGIAHINTYVAYSS